MDRKLSERFSYTLLLLAGIFLLGLALRLYCLDCYSLWFDEIASIEVAQRGLAAIFTGRFGWMQVQTPLHYLIVWLTIQPVDPTASAIVVRLPSVIAGALAIPATFLLGRQLFGRAQGILAGLFLALSAAHLNYSQDARPYAILLLLVVLSAWFLVKAVREASGRWWLGFAATTVIAILMSYNVLTLVLPAMAPFFVWTLWKAWRVRSKTWKPLIYAVSSYLAVGLACVPSLFDLARVPRTAPDLRQFSAATILTSPMELVSYFTRLGIGGQTERVIQMVFIILSLVGIYKAARQRHWDAIFLCLLFTLIPSGLLAILGTTNVVYERYALFVMPFYLLLVANGVAAICALVPASAGLRQSWYPRLAFLLAVVPVLSPFAYSAYAHSNLSRTQAFIVSNRPDFRGVSRYLSAHAGEDAIVIFGGWDPTVSYFYWKGDPPAKVYSIMDPLLYKHQVTGSVFWVFSYDNPLPRQILDYPEWSSVAHVGRITIFEERGPDVSVRRTIEALVYGLDVAEFRNRITQQIADTLRGSLYQASGQVEQASRAYQNAGTFFPIGGEYLRTSYGFAERNEPERAWRDALISKSMEPESPELHRWLAEMLGRSGHLDESRIELQIADALSTQQHK